MALQFNQVRNRVRALTAGKIDDAVVEAVVLLRIVELWESWDWSWTHTQGVLSTVGPHSEGTVTLGATPMLVQGVGTAFTAADVDGELIVGNSNGRYTVSAVNVGTQQLTLAFPYAGDSFVQSHYLIQRRIYPLAPDFNVRFEATWWRRLVESSLPTLNRYDGRRGFRGQQPISFIYSGLTPTGVQQVEVSPVPSSPIGIPYVYRRRAPRSFEETDVVPLREDMLCYLAAADAARTKVLELAETNPAAAQIYATESDKLEVKGRASESEAHFADLKLTSASQAVRDTESMSYYNDDYSVLHDFGSPI